MITQQLKVQLNKEKPNEICACTHGPNQKLYDELRKDPYNGTVDYVTKSESSDEQNKSYTCWLALIEW